MFFGTLLAYLIFAYGSSDVISIVRVSLILVFLRPRRSRSHLASAHALA